MHIHSRYQQDLVWHQLWHINSLNLVRCYFLYSKTFWCRCHTGSFMAIVSLDVNLRRMQILSVLHQSLLFSFSLSLSFPVWHLIQGAFTKSVRVYPGFPGWRDELGLSNCMAQVPRSPQRWANPQQGGQVPNNRASHLRIWLRHVYCVYNIRRWAAGAGADRVNEWVDLRALWNPGAGFRLKSVWNSIGKVEPWPGCACVTEGRGSLEDLVSDEYFTASRERSIHFHSPAIDTRTPQISQIRASSKQITLHSQVTLSESLDLIKWAPGIRSCVSSDQPYH